ncbi:MAG: hypothetical protein H7A01_08070 [Hahellaceae bacterium]|nr:hypothetical protein [Hahellaceae bacterium]MCP5211576.1 hypothetical protein [Hahellaceae bacterium]
MIQTPKISHPITEKILNSRPSALSMFKDLIGSGMRSPGKSLTKTSYALYGQVPDPKALSHYNKVCGFKSLTNVPVTWPHVMAFPLHIKLITHPGFPYPLAGLVHLKNCIKQYRRLSADEALDIHCTLREGEATSKGKTFDIVTEIHSGGRLVWEETSTNLYRVKATQEKNAPDKQKKFKKLPHYPESVEFDVPADQGRQYAKVSGDFNPIHISAISAKLFGFKAAIVHGMWSNARVLAELDANLPEAFTQTTEFKLPLLLPNTVALSWQHKANTIDFLLTDKLRSRPFIEGSISPLG